MEIVNWVQNHWAQIGVSWFVVQNFLKSLQDTLDAMPKGLHPLAEVVFIMQNMGGYLFMGSRPQSPKNGA